MITLNDRAIENIEIDGSYFDKDVHFVGGTYVDTGEDLTEKELEQLEEQYPDVMWEMAHDELITSYEGYEDD